MTLHIDIETFSEVDLKSAGAYRYAEHESTEVLCLGWAVDDGPVNLWIPTATFDNAILEGVGNQRPTAFITMRPDMPPELKAVWHLPKRAHNAQFERVILNGVAGKKLGLPPTAREEWTCTAVKAAANGIPRDLAGAAKALGTQPKDEAGRISMLQLAKPKRPTKADPATRWTFGNAPEKWIAMLVYNIDDVAAEREVDNALPDISENEQRLYHLDQKINDTGWAVDLKAVNDILFVVEQYKEQLAKRCEEITWNWLDESGLSPTQREKLSDWVRAAGYAKLADMQAGTIQKAILDPAMPPLVKELLLIYSTYNAKSVSKLTAMLDSVCSDGRLRGMFMFYGAATGRWSSLIVQLQNMMRPVIKDPDTAIDAFAARDLGLIRMLYPDVDPMKVAGSCIRGCLVATEGVDLVFPDYSGIEDRVNLWFFDEEHMLQVYRDYDAGKGRHPYSVTVCDMFGLDLSKFSDEDPRRQWGKVVRLSMGYEGGVEAYVTMADTYGIDLAQMAKIVLPLLPGDALDHAKWMRENHPYKGSDERVTTDVETACNGLKFLYRRNQPRIKQGWKDLKLAAEQAVEFRGQTFWLPNKKIAFKVEEYKGRRWLCMRLPSGRKIKYYNPEWTPPRESERWINNELVPYTVPGFFEYWGIDTYTRQYMRLQTYGGKLDENADQGFSRDILCNALLSIDAAGYPIVGSEHDKVIMEVAKNDSVKEIKALMLAQPAYCAGLPLACDGKRRARYGK